MSDRGSDGGVSDRGPSNPDEARVGVYICHCGGNISDIVDVQLVADQLSVHPRVVHSTTHLFMCSDPGQAQIEEDIREKGLNRIVVAACSPSLHELTFRRALSRAGLNPYLYEHVNIREHVSWVVENPELATQKAYRLVSAAVDRVVHQVPLEKRRIPIHASALVIGGGVSGLVAARDLARRGMDVTLLEKSPFLGGRMSQLDTVYPTGESARELLRELLDEVTNHPRIRLHTGAEVVRSRGFVGDYLVSVRLTPRGVKEGIPDAERAVEVCPEETPCEFEYGLENRRAIYTLRDGCGPNTPAIDWDTCTLCGDCVKAAGEEWISLDSTPTEIDIKCGVIILATGFNPYIPRQGEYGFVDHPQVMTLGQINRLLDPKGPTSGKLPRNGKPIRSIALIHCVGSRQHEGVHEPQCDGRVNDYCSRVCCTGLLHAACDLKERFPEVEIYDFHEDIRTYGMGHEEYYTQASERGVVFLRFEGREPPAVRRDETGASSMVVSCRDRLTGGMEVEVPADLVVLGTGIMPRDLSNLVELFRCAVGKDRFLLEVHPKLRPVELAVSGIFLAGTAQGPMDITESSAAAAAAAAKAASLMAQGSIELDPFVACVDENKCTGCQTCLSVCPFDALSRDEEKDVATVNEALCTGCGTCVATCPSDAIWQYGFSDEQIRAELEGLLKETSKVAVSV